MELLVKEFSNRQYTKEQTYILSSICYYGQAIVTIDSKSKIYLDGQILEKDGIIKTRIIYPRTIIWIEGPTFYDQNFNCCERHKRLKKERVRK
jgi:hypothetical protein